MYNSASFSQLLLIKDFRMLSRVSAVARGLSVAGLCLAGQAVALELPLPPPGEDVVGEVRVIQAKYEDTFADIATARHLTGLQ